MTQKDIELRISFIVIPDLWVFCYFFINFFETGHICDKFLFAIQYSYNFLNGFVISNQKLLFDKLNVSESIHQTKELVLSQCSFRVKSLIHYKKEKAKDKKWAKSELIMISSPCVNVKFVYKECEHFFKLFKERFLLFRIFFWILFWVFRWLLSAFVRVIWVVLVVLRIFVIVFAQKYVGSIS